MNSDRRKRAEDLFEEGYNCAQSVFLAFEDVHGVDFVTGAKLTSALGGGMGRLREVCGCVSGMMLALGMVSGGEGPDNDAKAHEIKKNLYEDTQALAKEFQNRNGSIVCRELLGLDGYKAEKDGEPSVRDSQYYKKRPCKKLCGDAAEILQEYLDKM